MGIMWGICGILCSVIVRYDLCSCKSVISGHCGYNVVVTLHGLIMIFFMVMPNLYSLLGNVVCIGMLGVCEVSYIRLNLMSWLLMILGVCEILNYCCCEYGIGVGWYLYPPLSLHYLVCLECLLCGILYIGITSTSSLINLSIGFVVVGIICFKLIDVEVLVLSVLCVSMLLMLVLPVLNIGVFVLYTDVHYNTCFCDGLFGGDCVMFEYAFWLFGHPEVYILLLPGLCMVILYNMVSFVVMLYGILCLCVYLLCIMCTGCIVWSHHMFIVGIICDVVVYFSVVSMIIILPTSTKLFVLLLIC